MCWILRATVEMRTKIIRIYLLNIIENHETYPDVIVFMQLRCLEVIVE